MPPGGEPVQGMGGDPQSQHPGKAQGGDGQRHRTHGAGAKIGNEQEGAEEYQCRAEVVHESQQPADHHGIGNEQNQVPSAHDPIHGGGSGKDEADLAQLRGLQGHAAQNQPVFRAVILRAEDQGDHQKAHARRHRQVAHHLGSFQIPQRPAQNQEGDNAQTHGSQLLHRLPWLDGSDGRHAHGTQEKGNGLHLEGFPVDQAIENVQHPLSQDDPAKPNENIGKVHLLPPEKIPQENGALQNGQQHQVRHAVPAAGGLGAKLRLANLLPLGDGLKLHFHPADGNSVLWLQGADLNGSVVDKGAGFGADVQKRPAAVVIPGQHRVIPGNGGKIDGHVAAFTSADDVFPVGNGNLGSVGEIQPGPDLRLPPEGQQWEGAPQQQKEGHHRHGVAQKADVLPGQFTGSRGQGLQNFFHCAPPLFFL